MQIVFRTFGSLLVGAALVVGAGNKDKSLAQESNNVVDKIDYPKLTETQLLKFVKDLDSSVFNKRDIANKQIKGFTKGLIKDQQFDHLEKVILMLQAELKTEGITLEYKRRIEHLVSSETFERYMEDLKLNDWGARLKNLDSNKDVRTDLVSVLVRLGVSNDETNRDFLLWNVWRLSDKTLEFLIQSGSANEKVGLAFSRYTPTQFLEKLSTDKIENVRCHVARNDNKNITPQILINLSKDESDSVRYFVVRNPKKPAQILTDLENDPSPYVRRAVAEETKDLSVARRLLDGLAKEKDPFLRGVVANDRNTRRETLMSLIDDPDPEVRASARKNLGLKD